MRHPIFASTCALSIAIAAPAAAQSSAERARSFDIPAQPMAAALETFGRQSGKEILFDRRDVDGKRSRAVRGNLSPAQALAQVIDGAGLAMRMVNADTFIVEAGQAGGAGLPSGANAGEEAPRTEIVVTGTNIRGAAPAGSQQIVLDKEYVQRSGFTSTEQLVESLPQNFRGGDNGASADAPLTTGTLKGLNFGNSSGVNLRGVGSGATLILLNGRRIASSGGGGYTDIAQIPIAAIERVEILPDGASAIYGSDAIGGVMNFILRSDYDGMTASGRVGATTEKGYSEGRAGLTYGRTWDSGHALVGLEYFKRTELSNEERSYTSELRDPYTVLPATDRKSLLISGSQEAAPGLTFSTDLTYSRLEGANYISDTAATYRYYFFKIDRINAAGGASYDLTPALRLRANLVYSREFMDYRTDNITRATGIFASLFQTRTVDQQERGTEAILDGSLLDLPGGALRFAVGGGYREQEYHEDITYSVILNLPAARNIRYGFGELSIPLFTEANAIPGFRDLRFSVAGRYDRYSDAGDSFNPKLGMQWEPLEGLQLRGSYGTSFRAAAVGRQLNNVDQIISHAIQAFRDANNVLTPVVYLNGATKLDPETAQTVTTGFTVRPAPGFSFEANYYTIDYSGRITAPPSGNPNALRNPVLAQFLTFYPDNAALRASLAEFFAKGGTLNDGTGGAFGPDPFSRATITYDGRMRNMASLKTRGLDMTVRQRFDLGGSALSLMANLVWVFKFEMVAVPGQPIIDTLNKVGGPNDIVGRAQAAWSSGGFTGALSFNYADPYLDSSAPVLGRVRSKTTFDLSLRYSVPKDAGGVLSGVSVSASALNLFDQDPPWVFNGGAGGAIHYDPANANPAGRFVSFEITKQW